MVLEKKNHANTSMNKILLVIYVQRVEYDTPKAKHTQMMFAILDAYFIIK